MDDEELVVRRGMSADEVREAERAFYRRRLNRGPNYDKSRTVRYVCDVCKDRQYLLGRSFERVMARCKTCDRNGQIAILSTLGYCVTSDLRCCE